MANQSIYNAFEQMWEHTKTKLNGKMDKMNIDTTPTSSSENLVYSYAVYQSITDVNRTLTENMVGLENALEAQINTKMDITGGTARWYLGDGTASGITVEMRRMGNAGNYTFGIYVKKADGTQSYLNLINADGTRNWAPSSHNHDSVYLKLTGGTVNGAITATTLQLGASNLNGGLELYHATPFIDFHFGRNTADYTSRIIETASGTLSINGVSVSSKKVAIYNASGAIVQFNLNNTLQNGSLYLSENGNFGLYSLTHSNWLIRGATDGVVHLQMPIALFGDSSTETQYFAPKKSGMAVLGTSGRKWNIVYAVNGTIQTSDRNAKEDFRTFDSNENYKKFFMDLKPMVYKFKEGTSGRDHFGFVSQDVEESLYKYGFDDKSFAGFCKDIKKVDISENEEAKLETVYDEDGNIQYDYSLRYDEFVSLNTYMIQKTIKENQELKNKIIDLESRIQKLEGGEK